MSLTKVWHRKQVFRMSQRYKEEHLGESVYLGRQTVITINNSQNRRYMFSTGLPDGIPKIKIWVDFGGSCNGRCCYIYVPLVDFTDNWYILLPCWYIFCHMEYFSILVCCIKKNLATLVCNLLTITQQLWNVLRLWNTKMLVHFLPVTMFISTYVNVALVAEILYLCTYVSSFLATTLSRFQALSKLCLKSKRCDITI
jgi:hypothetical protein